ncbi:hypothetical protein QYM36_008745 [Artemia franciscana]|uniref:Uncharacterized protein n=1 Tax=Artemia franciscana TaxID=6661 RepID=A0AA88HS58_ARTSF|nr:hypothetical protein QYM36_008745 [Artemia franciscana]
MVHISSDNFYTGECFQNYDGIVSPGKGVFWLNSGKEGMLIIFGVKRIFILPNDDCHDPSCSNEHLVFSMDGQGSTKLKPKIPNREKQMEFQNKQEDKHKIYIKIRVKYARDGELTLVQSILYNTLIVAKNLEHIETKKELAGIEVEMAEDSPRIDSNCPYFWFIIYNQDEGL